MADERPSKRTRFSGGIEDVQNTSRQAELNNNSMCEPSEDEGAELKHKEPVNASIADMHREKQHEQAASCTSIEVTNSPPKEDCAEEITKGTSDSGTKSSLDKNPVLIDTEVSDESYPNVDPSTFTPWHTAAVHCTSRAELLELVDLGFDAEATIAGGITPLHLACVHNNLTAVDVLRETALVELDDADDNGWRSLHFAAYYGHKEIVEYLVDAPIGCGSNSAEPGYTTGGPMFKGDGCGPGDLASWRGHKEIVEVMINAGDWLMDDEVVIEKVGGGEGGEEG